MSKCSWLPETRNVINNNVGWPKSGLEGARPPVMTSLVWPWDGNKWSLAGVIKRHPGLAGICQAMGERGQKGKEGSRMQAYCVSWRDLDSEALVLRSFLRPCFRLRLQHLPPATPVPSSNTPLHTARITSIIMSRRCPGVGEKCAIIFFFLQPNADFVVMKSPVGIEPRL